MVEQKILAKGSRLYLRPIALEDIPSYQAWMNDPAITRYLESRFRSWSADDLKDYIAQEAKRPLGGLMAIVRRNDDRHIGNIRLSSVNPVHRTASVGLLIGATDSHGRGFGSEAIGLVADLSFGAFGLRKLTAGVYASNVASHRAFLKAGFMEEGRQKAQWLDGETYVDGILLGRLGTIQA
jgi:ribosomal-protein-alanine N-acetyltransferase